MPLPSKTRTARAEGQAGGYGREEGPRTAGDGHQRGGRTLPSANMGCGGQGCGMAAGFVNAFPPIAEPAATPRPP